MQRSNAVQKVGSQFIGLHACISISGLQKLLLLLHCYFCATPLLKAKEPFPESLSKHHMQNQGIFYP